MNSPRFATNRTRLAQVLGIGRTLLYQFTRLPDAPPPRADGSHNVLLWRKFLASHSNKVKDVTEGDRLKIALLKLRLEREQLELAELNNSIRERITQEIESECCKILDALIYQLRGLPMQVAPKLVGLEVRPIFKKLQAEIDSRFSAAADALGKIVKQSRRKTPSKKKEASNVIEFNRARAGS